MMLAYLLDLVIGDPVWLPHPVRMIGKTILKVETLLRRYAKTPFAQKLAGIVLVIIIVLPASIITAFITSLVYHLHNKSLIVMCNISLVYLISATIAGKELINEGKKVIGAVKDGKLDTARSRLSRLVARDTETLSQRKILMATIETLSENLSDGIIAPMFYLAMGGLPFAIGYKAINTLDSMVGYKNERYIHFGHASARIDDIANFIPARITGMLIVITSMIVYGWSTAVNAFRTMLHDGKKHPSPNAGIPESAIAGALGVMLGGTSAYNGISVEKPYIGTDTNNDYLLQSGKAISIVRFAYFIGFCITTAGLFIRKLL
ncbi:MAG: adenosylcobinamide-phosphate synthase CbiB [Deltaproteobacteria bacterium]|nr:adenosylcobinamide-phosphate synthase CbiB [Deltaproteobacteria bacterium]MCL5793086.1 adenosylcobinamide-phosphate synthase CbiB [Deltaproteobacteria bacterium]